jgi:hypothetical protein
MLKPVKVEGIKNVHWETGRQVNDIPAVFHSAWQSPQGRLGIVLANWTTDTQAITVIDSRLGTQVVESRSAETVKTASRQVDGGTLPVTLVPLSCTLIEPA